MTLYDLRDKVAIITGSGRGIGRAIAIRLAIEKTKVVINAKRGVEEAVETVERIKQIGGEAIYVISDVSTREGCKKLVDKAFEVFGRIDILVNNAGIGLYALFKDLDEQLLEKQISADFRSVVYCSQEALRYMREDSVIVNIASLAGIKPLYGASIYNAMKAAVVQLTKSMALELAERRVRVFSVAPGFVKTKMGLSYFKVLNIDPDEWAEKHTLIKRLIDPEEVAELVVSLIKIPSFVGETVIIDGGASLI